ncbi:MAG: hypothetical protein IPP17_27265 [Bacteroidetes bacterium]|nr:hypothetical protein [Bacteroidota bacterium]
MGSLITTAFLPRSAGALRRTGSGPCSPKLHWRILTDSRTAYWKASEGWPDGRGYYDIARIRNIDNQSTLTTIEGTDYRQ